MFQPSAGWASFKADLPGNFRRFWKRVPGAPRVDLAEPACPLSGYGDLANQWRPAAVAGLAFVGDAAMVLDPVWGTGCGFAFLSADWLVETTLPAFGSARRGLRSSIDRALRRYRRVHRARTRWHYNLIADFSRVREDNPVEHLVFSAATRDPELARRVLTYLGRSVGPLSLGAPSTLGRAALVNARHYLSGRTPQGAPRHMVGAGCEGGVSC
jgi:flavin-dependent dehydrogenase